MGKKDSDFDIAQGSFDGAECAELVGLYILSNIECLNRRLNAGIYRDDFLSVMKGSSRQIDQTRKKIEAVFKSNGLGTTAESNVRIVNFLDVTINLDDGTFKPYCKPNNIPVYINKHSNHPPSIIKNVL